MALTKEGLQRAASIMDSILTDLTDPPGLAADLTEDERESLVALQNALDIVQSPLFSALVDIRDKCKKSVEDSERWNEAADVRGTDTADVVVQFKERYNIAGAQNGRQSSVNAIPDHLIDDTTITSEQSRNGEPSKAVDSSHVSLLSPKSHDECGPTLNAAHHRTPSISSSDSRGSVGSKRKKGRRQIGGGGVTLGHLARDQSPEGDIPLREFHERGLSASQQQSSDISLSSLSTEASPPPVPTSSPPDIFSDVSASPLSEASADKSEGEHTKDILFFMRDEKSMTDLRSALNGKWGRGHRNVELPHSSLTDSIGVELCGLSTTGVYVAAVRDVTLEDRLQIGDQILEVNGHTTENMAWFEVEHLILGAKETHKPIVSESTSHNSDEHAKLQLGERGEHRQGSLKLLAQYNPAGMGEVKRLNKTN